MKNYIKYPIALNKLTQELVEINNVTADNRKNLICKDCNDNFVSVLKHNTPHFKHKPNSSCKGNNESYIHWVTKELFKNINEIELPELIIDDLPEKYREKFQMAKNHIIDNNIPETFRIEFKSELKNVLLESRILTIEKIEIEKIFETTLGNIKVDIVAENLKEKIFIEPFFTHKIDEEKKRKLLKINTPTLTLDLLKFIQHYNNVFSIQELKKYLISKHSKTWLFFSNEKYDEYIENYEKYLLEEIIKRSSSISSHNEKLKKIEDLKKICSRKYEEIEGIKKDINDLHSNIYILEKELGIE